MYVDKKLLKVMELKQKIVNYYKTADCDRYGQLKTIDIYQVAETDKEREDLNNFVRTSTYGWTYGTYKGFAPWGSFKCKELEQECRTAFSQNPNRNNMNNW